MNILFSRDLCATLVLTFGHFLWIGTLIAIVTSMAVRRQQTSRGRYVAWLTGLLVMAGSPMLTFAILQVVPAAPPVTEMVNPAPAIDSPSQLPEVAPTDSEMDHHSDVPSLMNDHSEELPFKSVPSSPDIPVEVPQAPASMDAVSESGWWRDYAPLVMSFYLIGVAMMGLRLLLGLWGGHKLRYQSELITQRWMLDALQRQADALGLILVPAMAYCERVTVPTVLGILQPMILLPMTLASGLTPGQIESVLAHELAHLRRFDHLVNLLQCVIESLLFFHPAVWWLSRRVRDEREHCCDDLVIASGAVPLDYAASLLRVAELSREAEQRAHNQRRTFTAASLFATGDRPSTLRQRIARLLGNQTELHVRAVHSWVLFCLATCCVGAIGLLSSMTWTVLGEISRDRTQKTVIVEWSAIVDDSVMREIRAINSLVTKQIGSMQSPEDAKFSTLHCSAEDLRAIIRKHAHDKRLIVLQTNIRNSMPTGGWRIGPEKRAFQMIDSESIQTRDNAAPSYNVNWFADGNETREEDADRARLIVAGNYNFNQSGLVPIVTRNDTTPTGGDSVETTQQRMGTVLCKANVKFDSVMSEGEATSVVLSPPAVIRQHQEFVVDEKGGQWEVKNRPAPQLHAIFVHEAVRVPVKHISLFHKLALSKDWVLRGPAEAKEQVARIVEWRARPSRSVSIEVKEWTRELPSGGRVQLVGLGRPHEARMIWWTPEGDPLGQVSDNLGQSLSGMELAAIVRVWEDGVSRKRPPPKGMVHSGGVMDIPDTFPNKGSQLLVVPVVEDKATGRVSVKIGAGFGPWSAEIDLGTAEESTATLNGVEITTQNLHESHAFGAAGPPNFIKVTGTWLRFQPKSNVEFTAIAVARDGSQLSSVDDPLVTENDNRPSAQHFTHHLPKAEIHHFLVKSRSIHWTEFAGFATEPAAALIPPIEFIGATATDDQIRAASSNHRRDRITVDMPGGVNIEFVGLAEMTRDDTNWWKPDGEPLSVIPALAPPQRSTWTIGSAELRRSLFYVRGLKDRTAIRTNTSGTVAEVQLSDGEQVISWCGALQKNPQHNSAVARIGIATEPLSPTRIIDANGQRRPPANEATVDHIVEDITVTKVATRTGGQKEVAGKLIPAIETELSFATPMAWRQIDLRMVAIDNEGKSHRQSGAGGNILVEANSKTPGTANNIILFPLPPEQIDRFEYQVRLFRHWVTFENVAWQSGEATNLIISQDSIPVPKPQNYIAKLPDGRSVEFVGITKNTAPAKEGWKPDGRPIGDVGYWPATNYISGNTHGSFPENGEHPEPNAGAIDLLFRFRGLKAQPSLTFDLATKGGSHSHLPLKDPYELRVSAERRDPHPPGGKWGIPDGEMRVGLTDEPWGKWLQISPTGEVLNPLTDDDLYRSYYEQIQIMRTEPHERAPNKLALVLRTPQEMSRRFPFEIRGIDPDENPQWVLQWEGKGIEGTDLIEGRWGLATPEKKPLTRFEFRLRPYRHWVTFTGVSVEPGKESDVKLKTESVNDDRKGGLGANNQTIQSTPGQKQIEPENKINAVPPKPLPKQAELKQFSLFTDPPKHWNEEQSDREFQLWVDESQTKDDGRLPGSKI